MKLQLSAALMGLAATAVSAQYTQEGPFVLQIKGTKAGSKIDGIADSCHAGAAIEGLCYTSGTNTSTNEYSQYYFNYTTNFGSSEEIGIIVWNMPYESEGGTIELESQSMGLQYQINSNVAASIFGLDYTMQVGFDDNNELFGWDYYDDATFTDSTFPTTSENGTAYYQWAVCYQYFTGYYYQSVGWVQAGKAHNPTCEPVTITKVEVVS
ncbi:hypothetical protein F5Y16DRAFT_182982 [Xylariaceae sp. FL0255]|nr:hypothetical protein F5Y16DRAFT_182982 [Xylariaceae sp. FL0255]